MELEEIGEGLKKLLSKMARLDAKAEKRLSELCYTASECGLLPFDSLRPDDAMLVHGLVRIAESNIDISHLKL